MKKYFIILFAICFSFCTKNNKQPVYQETTQPTETLIDKPEFQSIIDTADVIGAILIYDLQKNTYYTNDFEWSKKGNLPASTFKIANSIIGLETGVIESDSTIFKWDGEEKWLKNWEQDLVLKDAFHFSCVPCYQEVARNIGAKRMNQYVDKLAYGDLKIDSTNIDQFWLEGASRISQMQQIDFLKRFYTSELPISARTESIMKNMMVMEDTDQYKLSGKTGLSNENKHYNGWFVGYVELKTNTYIFATNISPKKEIDFDSFIKKRLDITFKALQQMKVI